MLTKEKIFEEIKEIRRNAVTIDNEKEEVRTTDYTAFDKISKRIFILVEILGVDAEEVVKELNLKGSIYRTTPNAKIKLFLVRGRKLILD